MTGRGPLGRRLAAALVVGAAAGLAACVPQPPQTSYVDAEGEFTTLDWRDFPANAYTDVEAVLAGPVAEEVPQREEQLIGIIRTLLDEEYDGAVWSVFDGESREILDPDAPYPGAAADPAAWHPEDGNGYGGESMLSTYNGPAWQAEVTIPRADRPALLDRIADVLAPTGLEAAHEDTWESSPARESGWFTRGGEFLDVSIVDARLDADALAEAEEYGWLIAGVEIGYGITTVARADRAEFERRATPFIGRDWPAPTDLFD